MLKLKIYFRRVTRLSVSLAESPEQIFRQNPAYDSTQFVSDIGGSAGLILGISGKHKKRYEILFFLNR